MRYVSLVLCLAVFGCTPPSMNMQRSMLRGGCDAATTVALDSVPVDQLAGVRVDISSTCSALASFMGSGNVSDLTSATVTAKLQELVPERLRPYFSAVLAAVSSQQVNTAKIGVDNIKRINAAILGVSLANAQYATADR